MQRTVIEVRNESFEERRPLTAQEGLDHSEKKMMEHHFNGQTQFPDAVSRVN